MFLGIDIGSTSSKALIIDENRRIIATAIINTGTGTDGAKNAVEEVMKESKCVASDIKYSVVTGYGRMTYKEADKQITEISCHANGVHFLIPNVRTVIDIGGQDAKIIKLDRKGKVSNFAMNEKCAAGTGRFLEVMARVLGCKIDDLSKLADNSQKDITISSTCTVFAESEVISQLASSATREDVAKGAHKSIAKRIFGLGNRIGITPQIVMTGGVAKNFGVIEAMKDEFGKDIVVPEDPQITGALGAALFAIENYTKQTNKR